MAWVIANQGDNEDQVILTAGDSGLEDVCRAWATSYGGVVGRLNINYIYDYASGALCAAYGVGNRSVNCHFAFFAYGLTQEEIKKVDPNYNYPYAVNKRICQTTVCAGSDYLITATIREAYLGRDFWPSHHITNPFTLIENVYTSSLSCSEASGREDAGTVLFYLPSFSNWPSVPRGRVDVEKYNDVSPNHVGGESCRYVAKPNENFRVKRWSLNGTQLYGSANEVNISLPSASATIHCEFEQYKFPVTVTRNVEDAVGRIYRTNENNEIQSDGTITSSYHEDKEVVGIFTAKVVDEANYRFAGWYKRYADNASPDTCNILVQSGEVLTLVAEDQAVTYCAKFVSRKTTLKVDVASVKENGVGTFDITVNDKTISGQTEYNNEDARDGWRVVLTAKPYNDYSYFDHWLIPFGNAATQDVYEPTLSMDLLAREANAFTAYFSGKTKKTIGVEIVGKGEVSYDSFDGKGNTSEAAEFDVYEESEVVFTATKSDKLYAFDYWEYAIGSTWAKLTNEAKPTWVRSVNEDEDQVVIFFPNTWTTTSNLRAVFKKLNTFTISKPVIKGEHPLTGSKADAPDSGCKVSELPEADDKGDDNKPLWLEGTTFELTVTQGAKWQIESIEIVYKDDTIKYEDGETSVSVEVTGDIKEINVVFSARRYEITPKVDAKSAPFGVAKLTYHDEDKESVTTAKTARVYVDDEITLSAETNVEDYGNAVEFHDWMQNDIETTFPSKQTLKVTGSSTFTARFATRQTFILDATITDNSKDYQLGDIKVSYQKDGYVSTLNIPTEKGATTEAICLLCGSTMTLEAEARDFKAESGASYTGYFNGWFNVNDSSEETGQISGWGERVESVEVGEPRQIKAKFLKENRWPILSLRNPPDTQYTAFAVAGARTDRVQQVTDTETVTLTNENDYFCDPFSVVQIRLDKYNSNDRFSKWVTFTKTVGEDGKEVLTPSNETYSTDQDLSVFMTGNLSLMPIFYTGNPIEAEATLANGVDESWGSVSLDGEPIEKMSDSKATFMQGDTVYFVANPRNGYRFSGWSSSADGATVVNTEARFKVTMDVTRKYYAIFKKDTNAIFTFGTSAEVKRLTWHSKRVEVNSPVSFSVAKVDAEGYDEALKSPQLTVFKASSPDVPKRGKTYQIKDSNTRRLALDGRNEKAFEFEVSSVAPINKVQIATSVTGLMGGA